MPHIITQSCIGTKDTSCVDVCPVDCIHPRKDEPDFAKAEMLYINPETCIDCGLCVDECPVKAIFSEDDLPAEMEAFIEKNAEYYANQPKS
ncbi:MAG: ferredoxin family protein [Phycisphaerales bacterium]|nr:ferredoxin family protein [Phycisphaerales bacterium]